MLDILGGRYGTCDGVSRRNFLRVGVLGLGGLTLPDILRLQANAATPRHGKTAVIQIFLGGGPTQLETWDPKPDAPKEFRGEFNAIKTNVPGIALSELFPRQAQCMDKLAIVRSLHHDTSDHGVGAHWVMTGFPSSTPLQRSNDRPSIGSVVSKLRGSNGAGLPPYIGIPNPPSFGQASYLGAGFNPFAIEGDPQNGARVRNLEPSGSMTLGRIEDRRYLLSKLDRINRQRDASGMMDGLDHFTAQAYEMVTGPEARKAFDLTKEDPKLRDRYGRTRLGQGALLARRLVEAGVTFVTLSEGNWDHHAQVFQNCRQQLPPLDNAVATLVEDIHERGLADQVLVLVWGEFGRTPKVNGSSGRDHWPNSMSALLAGGGLKMGQVIGATNRKGEVPIERPVRPEHIIRTVYHVLGINPFHEFTNESGRPMPVMNIGEPISELVG